MSEARITRREYDGIEGINISGLITLGQCSPKHFRYGTAAKQTKFTALGTLEHAALFEPERFEQAAIWVTTHPDGRKRPRNGKTWESFQLVASLQEQLIATDTEHDHACKMRDAVLKDPAAAPLLRPPGSPDGQGQTVVRVLDIVSVWRCPRVSV